MLELLRSLEWCGGGEVVGWCPVCDQSGVHTPECTLAATIRALEAPGFKGRQPGERVEALTPYGWQDAEVVRIEGSGAVRVETDSAATWVVSLGNVRRKGEPTVDEMAWEMELDRVTYTDDAIRTLYREHKARQATDRGPIGRSTTGATAVPLAVDPPRPDSPPTDPAAWLYARVMPGRTVAEVRFPDEGPESKFVVDRVDLWPDDGRVTVTSADKSTMAGTEAITRLLNPDGTVLWEAK